MNIVMQARIGTGNLRSPVTVVFEDRRTPLDSTSRPFLSQYLLPRYLTVDNGLHTTTTTNAQNGDNRPL